MSFAPVLRLAIPAVTAAALAFIVAGCSTPGTPAARPAPVAATPTEDPAVLVQARFERLVQRLLETESRLTVVLEGVASSTGDRPAQAAVLRDLLAFLQGEELAAILTDHTALTSDSILANFTPETAAALKSAQLDRPLFTLVDGLARLAGEIGEMETGSEEGRALARAFLLIRRDVLPAVVETRLLLTEEQLDANEGAALARRIEETLQSINEQLTSLQQRARSLSSPTAPAPPAP